MDIGAGKILLYNLTAICLLLLTGCSSSVRIESKVAPEKVRDKTIQSVEVPVKVGAISTTDGETIGFLNKGGYNPDTGMVVGIDSSGTERSFRLNQLDFLQIIPVDSVPGVSELKSIDVIKEELSDWIRNDSTGIFYPPNDWLDFDQNGAKFDVNSGIITGNSEDDQALNIDYHNTTHIQYNILDENKPGYEFGLKIGTGHTNIRGTIPYEASPGNKTGAGFGLFFRQNVRENISFQFELIYAVNRFELKRNSVNAGLYNLDYSENVSFSYLDIPVLFKIDIPAVTGIETGIYGGSSLSFTLDNELKVDSTFTGGGFVRESRFIGSVCNLADYFVSIVFGIENITNIGFADFVVDFRYRFQLTNTLKDISEIGSDYNPEIEYPLVNINGESSDIKTDQFQIWLGIKSNL